MSNDLRWEVSLRKQPIRGRTVKLPVMMIGEDEPSLIDADKVFNALPELIECVSKEFGMVTKTARLLIESQIPLINNCKVRTFSRWRPLLVSLHMTSDQIREKLQDPQPEPSKWFWVVMEGERVAYLAECQQDAIDWLSEQDGFNGEIAYADQLYHWKMNGRHMPAFGYFTKEIDARNVPVVEGMVLELLDLSETLIDEDAPSKPRYRKGQRRSGK